jgi:hypothetical protein
MPCARSGHSATLVEDDLIIFGAVLETWTLALLTLRLFPSLTLTPRLSVHVLSGHAHSLTSPAGGWDMPAVFNDCFCLDMTTLEFSALNGLAGLTPSLRSWHAAAMLPAGPTGQFV